MSIGAITLLAAGIGNTNHVASEAVDVRICGSYLLGPSQIFMEELLTWLTR